MSWSWNENLSIAGYKWLRTPEFVKIKTHQTVSLFDRQIKSLSTRNLFIAKWEREIQKWVKLFVIKDVLENWLNFIYWWVNIPKGGLILRNNVTTSRCFIRPLASGSYSLHSLRKNIYFSMIKLWKISKYKKNKTFKTVPDKFIQMMWS